MNFLLFKKKDAYCSHTYVGYDYNSRPLIKCKKTKGKCVGYDDSVTFRTGPNIMQLNKLNLEQLAYCPMNPDKRSMRDLLGRELIEKENWKNKSSKWW